MATWLKVPQAAQYAGVSRDTIYTACARSELRHVRIGGRRAISRIQPPAERAGSGTPASAKPFARSRQLSQWPHGRPDASGS